MTTGDFGTLGQHRTCSYVNLISGRLKLGVRILMEISDKDARRPSHMAQGKPRADDAWAIMQGGAATPPVLGWQYNCEILE